MGQKSKAKKEQRKNKALGRSMKQIVPEALHAIAEAQADKTLKNGADRLDFAAGLLAGALDIPLVPEPLEKLIFKVVLSGTVELLKKLFGRKKWFVKLEDLLDGDDD